MSASNNLQAASPLSAWSMAIAASRFMSTGDSKSAISALTQAFTLNPNNEVIALNLTLWTAASIADPLKARGIIECWSKRFLDPLTMSSRVMRLGRTALGRRYRVGYVSADFNNHPSRFFIQPILKHHNKARFEIHAFMTGESDVFTDGLRPLVEHWHDVGALSDEELFALIHAIGIDVLIDLSGHTKGQRLGVFARRAAPVQMTWFGYMQTLGMKAMDWRITDSMISPPGSDQFYTEKLLRISSHYAFQPPVNMPEPPPLPARENGFVTMVCLNDTRKVSDESLALWSKILHDNQNAGLIIISAERSEEFADESLRPRLKLFQLPDDRVSVVPRLNFQTYLNLSAIADFAVDTTPISGGTTTLLGISIGLPTLCLNKPDLGTLSTLSAAMMRQIGLDDCIATDKALFIEKASSWINDWDFIDQLRHRCLSGLKTSPLLQHATITRELEQAYIQCFTE